MGKIIGGVGRTLFGGPSKGKSKSQSTSVSDTASGNYAYPELLETFRPTMGMTNGANSMVASLLGMNGDEKGREALDNFSNSSGMDFIRDEGVKALDSSQAGRGVLQSGATGKALMQYGQNLGKTNLNSFMDRLLGLGDQGLKAGSVVSGAGGWGTGHAESQSTSKSKETGAKKGIAAELVKIAAAAGASDPRLKTNVTLLATMPDGLNVYSYEYIDGYDLPKGLQVGVMADEVRELRPAAYIPNYLGEYAGVDYARL